MAPRVDVPDREPGIGLAGAQWVGPAPAAPVPILISLRTTNSSALGDFLLALSNPLSPLYHRYLTQQQFDHEFGGAPGPYHALEAFVRSFGVAPITTTADRLSLTFEATPRQIAEIFGVQLGEYVLHGRAYLAPTGSPRLPSPVAPYVAEVVGLSTYSMYTVHPVSLRLLPSVHGPPVTRSVPASVQGGYVPPATVNGVQYEYAPDFQVAYDELGLFQNAGYPTNGVVASILWGGCRVPASTSVPCSPSNYTAPYVPSNVNLFFNETLPAGEPHPQIEGLPVNGALSPGPSAAFDVTGASVETTLDLEMIGSTAPGSTIVDVYGPNPTLVNLDAAFTTVLNPPAGSPLRNVSVVTNSWGGTDQNDTAWYTGLEEAQARGITVLAASGDSGNSDVNFPSTMAYDSFGVTAVGGTTPTLDAASGTPGYLTLANQTVWYQTNKEGSTGGVSSVFPEPSWQRNSSANRVIQSTGMSGRATPDIAALANNTLLTITVGTMTYDATNASTGGPFFPIAGTSVASPLEAGVVATIDHVLKADGNAWLGFLNPSLYALGDRQAAPFNSTGYVGFIPSPGSTYNSPLPTLPFYDVTSGHNQVYGALRGWDLVTGWGSIDAYNYTMYMLNVNSNGVSGRLSGVEDTLSLNALKVTSYKSGSIYTTYNASIQQNFFLANSLGAPIYWVQNVIYIRGGPSQWGMAYTGWVIFPFYGLYPQQSVYEYNFPPNVTVSLPKTFVIRTTLIRPPGFNSQEIDFSVAGQNLTLPVPGAAYVIGSLGYNYSWQGRNYSNGPYPNNPMLGGLSPQFGLVGGPSGATGEFQRPTNGSLVAMVQPYGSSSFVPARTAVFDQQVDQTGEIAANLSWNRTGANTYGLSVVGGSPEQGVLSYVPVATPRTYQATFAESGLPAGTPWTVTINGESNTQTAPANVTVVGLTNGTYAFSVNASGFAASPESGTITIAGQNTSEAIVFRPLPVTNYTMTVEETGLPVGTAWEMWMNSTTSSRVAFNATTGSVLGFTLPSGGYERTLGLVPGYFQTTIPYRSSVSLNGNLTVLLQFAPTTYQLRFEEIGLPVGTPWSVVVGNRSYSSVTAIIDLNATNGSYAFTVGRVAGYSASPPSGVVAIDGGPATQGIVFTSVSPSGVYNVTFEEIGLPTGTLWGVTFNGTQSTTTSSTLTYTAGNGTYAYQVSLVTGYVPSPSSGAVFVLGAGQVKQIGFHSVPAGAYPVTFSESGLPTGALWAVFVDGVEDASSGSTIVVLLDNGTYPYEVANVTGWIPNIASGTVVVAGRGSVVPIEFERAFSVSFTASGLPSGTNWSLTLAPASSPSAPGFPPPWSSITVWSDGRATIVVALPNGTYQYSTTASGYSGGSGTLTVAGATSGPTVTFNPTGGGGGSGTLFGIPMLYVEIAVVVGIVAIVGAVVASRAGRRGRPPATGAAPSVRSGGSGSGSGFPPPGSSPPAGTMPSPAGSTAARTVPTPMAANCPRCGNAATFYPQYGRFYCHRCSQYL